MVITPAARAQLACEADAAYSATLTEPRSAPSQQPTLTPVQLRRLTYDERAKDEARARLRARQAHVEVPQPTQVDPFAELCERFREERLNLIFAWAQVSTVTRFDDLVDLMLRWKRHKYEVEKYCTEAAREGRISVPPLRYFREKIHPQDAYEHFQRVYNVARKRCTKAGRALRSKANRTQYVETVKPRRASRSAAERDAANAVRREQHSAKMAKKTQERINSARFLLDQQKELADVLAGRVGFHGRDPEKMRQETIASLTHRISEIRKSLGKAFKRTMKLLADQSRANS